MKEKIVYDGMDLLWLSWLARTGLTGYDSPDWLSHYLNRLEFIDLLEIWKIFLGRDFTHLD